MFVRCEQGACARVPAPAAHTHSRDERVYALPFARSRVVVSFQPAQEQVASCCPRCRRQKEYLMSSPPEVQLP
eukprot:11223985-Lingulodinium_polyedra.AAC.1